MTARQTRTKREKALSTEAVELRAEGDDANSWDGFAIQAQGLTLSHTYSRSLSLPKKDRKSGLPCVLGRRRCPSTLRVFPLVWRAVSLELRDSDARFPVETTYYQMLPDADRLLKRTVKHLYLCLCLCRQASNVNRCPEATGISWTRHTDPLV